MNSQNLFMHTTSKLILAGFMLQGALALAASSSDSASDSRPNPPPMSAEMKAAFEACKSKGRPGETAFDECMTSKGFTKPQGGQRPPAQ